MLPVKPSMSGSRADIFGGATAFAVNDALKAAMLLAKPEQADFNTTETLHAVRLEIDNNTDPDHTVPLNSSCLNGRPWHLGALLLSVAVGCMIIEGLMLAHARAQRRALF
jgi:hypothetical protein